MNKKSVHAWELTVKKHVLRFGEHTIFLLQECENWPSSNDLAGGSSTTVLHGHYGWFHNAGSKVGILVPPFMLGDDKLPMSWSKGATYGLRLGRVGVMNSYLPDSEKGNDVFMEEIHNLIEVGERMLSRGCNILIWGGDANTELYGHNITDGTIGPYTMTRNSRVARGNFAITRRTALVNFPTFWDGCC